nr:MbcA/ParS/Xre antitoxin family protein [[Pseudomonas] sp. BICA1-14]
MPESVHVKRFDQVEALAVEVFENRAAAISWLTSPNIALGGKSPQSLCSTDLGATQVRRLLRCLEYGGLYKLLRLDGFTMCLVANLCLLAPVNLDSENYLEDLA